MTTEEYLRRHLSRMGARLKLQLDAALRVKIRINVSRDRSGEFFDIRCWPGTNPEILDVRPDWRHMVLMVRDDGNKNKFLLGRDERHWFVAALPDDGVHDVRTAIASLRPEEIEGKIAIRQGEWFFVPAPDLEADPKAIQRNEPLTRSAWSKPHICEQMVRQGGVVVMVCSAFPAGITEPEYHQLIESDPTHRHQGWRRMVRDAEVYVRGEVRHRDHKTLHLERWHRVYMNRERFAAHAGQIAFLD